MQSIPTTSDPSCIRLLLLLLITKDKKKHNHNLIQIKLVTLMTNLIS